MKKVYREHSSEKAGMAILISDKVDFRAKEIIRGKEGHYIKITEIIHLDDLVILNVCAPNNRTSKHMKQTLKKVKGENFKSTIII